ncbi:MAG: hypothetical protein KKB50_01095 [Planctomycetes bacterium]|nr:hypothetical protein [Planctomycetota bacterium]
MNNAVPEHWAPSASAPVAAGHIGWLLALPAAIALWFVPGRMSASVSRSTWAVTVFVHMASLWTAASLLAATVMLSTQQGLIDHLHATDLQPLDLLRIPSATLVSGLFMATENSGDIYAALGVILAIHGVTWLLGFLLMPFIAAGERGRRLYFRSVKLVLWSTTCLVPPAALVLLAHLADLDNLLDEVGLGPGFTKFAFVIAALAWWTNVVLRLGTRYAGPPEGPGWEPNVPRCNGCGYALTGLPLDGRCPECNHAVHASLPQTRQSPSWTQATRWSARPRAYIRTARAILRERDFFRTLAVYEAPQAATRFAICTCFVAGLVGALGSIPILVGEIRSYWVHEMVFSFGLTFVTIALALSLLCFVGLALMALRACRLGQLDPRPTTVATCYASVLLLGTMLLVTLCQWAAHVVSYLHLFPGSVYIRGWGPLPHQVIFGMVISLLPLAALIWGLVRLRRALTDVRYASA